MEEDIDYDGFEGDIYGPSDLTFGTGQPAYATQYSQPPGLDNDEESSKELEELKEQLAASESEERNLQETLRDAAEQSRQWEKAYREMQAAVPDLQHKAAWAEAQLKSREGAEAKSGEAMYNLKLAEQHQENLELRRILHTGRRASNPQIAQLRQLVLDPAVFCEFEGLTSLLKERDNTIVALKDAEEANLGMADSGSAAPLMVAKANDCQGQNDVYQAKFAAIDAEQQLLMVRGYAEEMHRVYRDLEDHVSALDDDSEDLSMQAFNLRKRLKELEEKEGDGQQRQGNNPGSFERWGNRPRYQGRGNWGNRGPAGVPAGPGGTPRGDQGPGGPRNFDRHPAIKRPQR